MLVLLSFSQKLFQSLRSCAVYSVLLFQSLRSCAVYSVLLFQSLRSCAVYSVLPFKISPNHIVITSNYEVAFTSVASFLSLTPSQTELVPFKR